MFPPARILVPVVFSERCRRAARYAAALARRFHSELTLLHVVVPPFTGYGGPESLAYSTATDLTGERREESRVELDNFLNEELRELNVTRVLAEGDPTHEIVEHAQAGAFDLVVMPTHGHGTFRRFLLGSVTAKVLHDADCPVWTGPHLEEEPEHDSVEIRNILCALDLGPQTRTVLSWASRAAEQFASHLAIIHALPISTARAGGFFFDPDWGIEMSRSAKEEIARLQQELGVSAEVHVTIGDIPATAADTAKRLKADLLVIGRGHRSGVLGRLRTHAYAIIRESPCAVVSV